MKLAFVATRQDLTSIKIRAIQMAKFLNCSFLLDTDKTCNDYDILIYVKYPGDIELMGERKKKGILQIMDPIDNFEFKEFNKRKDFIDGFIAASISHKVLLSKMYSVPVESIPHHHSNFNEKKISIKPNDNLVIGYVGDKTHYKKVKFLEKHFENIFKDIKYNNLEKSYLSIDIGFAYRIDKMKIIYNSSLKLLNYMSYGIPSVLNFENGYSEVGNHGEHCLFVESKKELIESLKFLSENYELRKKMSEAGFQKAKDYHYTKIVPKYKSFLFDSFKMDIE